MDVLERFTHLVQQLQSTTGRLEKEAFLIEYHNDAEVKSVLHFLFNPYIVTGISKKKLAKDVSMEGVETPTDLLELLEYFKTNNTGRDIDVAVLKSFGNELVNELVKKDLKLGVQEKTLNKVFGAKFIPVMDVMLAESYFENQSYLDGREFVVTQKLDGVRAIMMVRPSGGPETGQSGLGNDALPPQADREGTPVFYTRGGRVIEDLVELTEEGRKLDPLYVYDGELLLTNPPANATTAEIYRLTVKITNSDDIKRGVDFNVFDRVLLADFVDGISHVGARERKAALTAELNKLGLTHIRDVGVVYDGGDVSVIAGLLDQYTANGEEGLMINPADSPYECKRTKNLLKVKKFQTADVRVISVEEGSGANRGKLGAVHVIFLGPDGREHTCKVGSGFSKEHREHYWKNQHEIIGKIIEIGYFELSKNQRDDEYSLRFPTFKDIRPDKDEISMH